MRRRAIIALFLGFVVCVLVAWRCLFVVPTEAARSTDMTPREASQLWKEILGAEDANGRKLEGGSLTSLGCTEYMSFDHEAIEIATDMFFGETPPPTWVNQALDCVRTEVGWPMRCLYAETVTVSTATGEQGFAVRGWMPMFGRSVPYAPRWFGLFANTIFYSTFVFVLLSVVRRIRRRARRDRELCPQCKYDLRAALVSQSTTVTCPECGRAYLAKYFHRSRQLLRWWMVPLVLPTAVLLMGVCLAYFDWRWLRFQLRWVEMIWTPFNLYVFGVLTLWIFLLAWDSYDDRHSWKRFTVATVISALLSMTSFVSVYSLAVHFYGYP